MRPQFKRLILGVIITSLMVIVSIASAQEAGERLYTIQPGDTLQAIANANNVPLQSLLVRNAIIDPNRIRSGQQIIIPTTAITLPTTHVVQPGERLSDIAIRYNTTVEELRQLNSLTTNLIFVGETLRLPPVTGAVNFPITYRIEAGDTLREIAERYGITWQLLAAYNNITNPNIIAVGATIIIPPQGTPMPTPTPAPVVVQPIVAQPVIVQPVVAQPLRVGTRVIPPITGNRYTVQAGDTMFAIGAASGVNIYAIAQANGILNLNRIYVGQTLIIPR